MSLPIPAILQAPNMAGVVQTVQAGLPTNHLPPGLLSGNTRPIEGNVFDRFTRAGQQQVIKQTAHGAPSRPRTATGLGERPGKTIGAAEHMEIKGEDLQNLVDPESGPDGLRRQEMGEYIVSGIIEDSVVLRQNLRTAALTSALALGHIYFDGEGNLLPSSSGAVIDIDYAIPANNLNQLNGIIGASWGLNTTDILGDLNAIQQAAVQISGLPIKHALYGINIPKYFMTNTDIRDLVIRNSAANDKALAGMVFNVGGITWWPGYFGFFKDSSGTNQVQISGDTVVFLPEPGRSWYELVEGTTVVYSKSGATETDLNSWKGAISKQRGMWQYAVIQTDPVGAKLVYGDNFIPDITNPNAVFVADVTP